MINDDRSWLAGHVDSSWFNWRWFTHSYADAWADVGFLCQVLSWHLQRACSQDWRGFSMSIPSSVIGTGLAWVGLLISKLSRCLPKNLWFDSDFWKLVPMLPMNTNDLLQLPPSWSHFGGWQWGTLGKWPAVPHDLPFCVNSFGFSSHWLAGAGNGSNPIGVPELIRLMTEKQHHSQPVTTSVENCHRSWILTSAFRISLNLHESSNIIALINYFISQFRTLLDI